MHHKLTRGEFIRNLDETGASTNIGLRTSIPLFVARVPKHIMRFPWQSAPAGCAAESTMPNVAADPTTTPTPQAAGCSAAQAMVVPRPPPPFRPKVLLVTFGLKIPLPGHQLPLHNFCVASDGPTLIECIRYYDHRIVNEMRGQHQMMAFNVKCFHDPTGRRDRVGTHPDIIQSIVNTHNKKFMRRNGEPCRRLFPKSPRLLFRGALAWTPKMTFTKTLIEGVLRS